MKKYDRNKKRRKIFERKKEVKEDEVTKKNEPAVEVTKVTEEERITDIAEPTVKVTTVTEGESKIKKMDESGTEEGDKKENEIKLDNLIRKLSCQDRPIDYLAERIKLNRDNKNKYHPFSDGFAKAVNKLVK